MALRYDLRINQGETFQLAIPVLDADGDPVDLTGMTAQAQVRSHQAAAEPLYEWSIGALNLAFDGNDVILRVPAAASSAWTFRTGVYALELTDTDGDVTLLAEGFVIVHPEVNR